MSARVELQNIEEFRNALRNLPADMAREADAIVSAHAEEAGRLVQEAYPVGPTGNLKRGVTTEINSSRFGISGIVRSRAKHASIFEKGTQRRQTAMGANRGAMPQPPASERAIPKFVRVRARMVKQLIELVKRAGFEVEA